MSLLTNSSLFSKASLFPLILKIILTSYCLCDSQFLDVFSQSPFKEINIDKYSSQSHISSNGNIVSICLGEYGVMLMNSTFSYIIIPPINNQLSQLTAFRKQSSNIVIGYENSFSLYSVDNLLNVQFISTFYLSQQSSIIKEVIPCSISQYQNFILLFTQIGEVLVMKVSDQKIIELIIKKSLNFANSNITKVISLYVDDAEEIEYLLLQILKQVIIIKYSFSQPSKDNSSSSLIFSFSEVLTYNLDSVIVDTALSSINYPSLFIYVLEYSNTLHIITCPQSFFLLSDSSQVKFKTSVLNYNEQTMNFVPTSFIIDYSLKRIFVGVRSKGIYVFLIDQNYQQYQHLTSFPHVMSMYLFENQATPTLLSAHFNSIKLHQAIAPQLNDQALNFFNFHQRISIMQNITARQCQSSSVGQIFVASKDNKVVYVQVKENAVGESKNIPTDSEISIISESKLGQNYLSESSSYSVNSVSLNNDLLFFDMNINNNFFLISYNTSQMKLQSAFLLNSTLGEVKSITVSNNIFSISRENGMTVLISDSTGNIQSTDLLIGSCSSSIIISNQSILSILEGQGTVTISTYPTVQILNKTRKFGSAYINQLKSDNFVYIIDGNNELVILNRTVLPSLSQISSLFLPSIWSSHIQVSLNEKFALVSDVDTPQVQIVNIQDKKQPTIFYTLNDIKVNYSCFNTQFSVFIGDSQLYYLPTRKLTFQTEIFLLEQKGENPFSLIKMEYNESGAIVQVGQSYLIIMSQLFQSRNYQLNQVKLLKDNEILKQTNWITIQKQNNQIQLFIPKELISQTNESKTIGLVLEYCFALDSNDFAFLKGVDTLQILASLNVIDLSTGCVNSQFISQLQSTNHNSLSLKQWLNISDSSYNTLIQTLNDSMYFEVIQLKVQSSLSFNLYNQSNIISTLHPSDPITISLHFEQENGCIFVNQLYKKVLVSISLEQTTLQIRGQANYINEVLYNKVVFQKQNNCQGYSRIKIIIDDQINYINNQVLQVSQSTFLTEKQPLIVQYKLQEQVKDQSISNNDFYLETQISVDFQKDSFIDPNSQENSIVYSIQQLLNGQFQNISTSFYIKFDAANLRIFGIIPYSAIYSIEKFKIIANNGYSQVSDEFYMTFQTIPISFVINFILKILGPIAFAIGVYQKRSFILNIIYKKDTLYSLEHTTANSLYRKKITLIGSELQIANLFFEKYLKLSLKASLSRSSINIQVKQNKQSQQTNLAQIVKKQQSFPSLFRQDSYSIQKEDMEKAFKNFSQDKKGLPGFSKVKDKIDGESINQASSDSQNIKIILEEPKISIKEDQIKNINQKDHVQSSNKVLSMKIPSASILKNSQNFIKGNKNYLRVHENSNEENAKVDEVKDKSKLKIASAFIEQERQLKKENEDGSNQEQNHGVLIHKQIPSFFEQVEIQSNKQNGRQQIPQKTPSDGIRSDRKLTLQKISQKIIIKPQNSERNESITSINKSSIKRKNTNQKKEDRKVKSENSQKIEKSDELSAKQIEEKKIAFTDSKSQQTLPQEGNQKIKIEIRKSGDEKKDEQQQLDQKDEKYSKQLNRKGQSLQELNGEAEVQQKVGISTEKINDSIKIKQAIKFLHSRKFNKKCNTQVLSHIQASTHNLNTKQNICVINQSKQSEKDQQESIKNCQNQKSQPNNVSNKLEVEGISDHLTKYKNKVQQVCIDEQERISIDALIEEMLKKNPEVIYMSKKYSFKQFERECQNKTSRFYNCLKAFGIWYLLSLDTKTLYLFKYIKHYTKKIKEYSANDWYKSLVDVIPTSELDSFGSPIPFSKLKIKQLHFQKIFEDLQLLEQPIAEKANISNEDIFSVLKKYDINAELLKEAIYCYSLGLYLKKDKFSKKKCFGESLHLQQHQVVSVEGFKKIDHSRFMGLRKCMNLTYSKLPISKHISLPSWIQYDCKNGVIILEGIPTHQDIEEILIRIFDSSSFATFQFSLKVNPSDEQIQITGNGDQQSDRFAFYKGFLNSRQLNKLSDSKILRPYSMNMKSVQSIFSQQQTPYHNNSNNNSLNFLQEMSYLNSPMNVSKYYQSENQSQFSQYSIRNNNYNNNNNNSNNDSSLQRISLTKPVELNDIPELALPTLQKSDQSSSNLNEKNSVGKLKAKCKLFKKSSFNVDYGNIFSNENNQQDGPREEEEEEEEAEEEVKDEQILQKDKQQNINQITLNQSQSRKYSSSSSHNDVDNYTESSQSSIPLETSRKEYDRYTKEIDIKQQQGLKNGEKLVRESSQLKCIMNMMIQKDCMKNNTC